PNISAAFGAKVSLKGTLKAGVTAIPNATVEFFVDGVSLGTAVTNSSGVAILSHTVTESVGIHTLTAKFAGDSVYAPTSKDGTLTVKKASTKLTGEAKTAKANSSVNLGAKLI